MTKLHNRKILIDAYLDNQEDIVNMIHARFAGHLDRPKIEDIFSNAFVDICEKIQRGRLNLETSGESLKAYLYRACYLQACKKVERNKEVRMPEVSIGEQAGTVDDSQLMRLMGAAGMYDTDDGVVNACDEAECEHAVSVALQALKEPCRRILMLHYWDGFSYKHIAQHLGKRAEAVKMQAKRCKDTFINHNKHILELCRR